MELAGGRGTRDPVNDPFEGLGFADAGRANNDAVRAQGYGFKGDGPGGFVDADRHVEVAHARGGRGGGGGLALLGLGTMHALGAGGAFGASSWPGRIVVFAPGGVEASAVGEVDARDEDSGACRERHLGDRPYMPVSDDHAGGALTVKKGAPQVV